MNAAAEAATPSAMNMCHTAPRTTKSLAAALADPVGVALRVPLSAPALLVADPVGVKLALRVLVVTTDEDERTEVLMRELEAEALELEFPAR
jgi:hypothetical protein